MHFKIRFSYAGTIRIRFRGSVLSLAGEAPLANTRRVSLCPHLGKGGFPIITFSHRINCPDEAE